MFSGCHSLISLPDLSKWKIYNVGSLAYKLFSNCYSLVSLPDISKWNIPKINGIKENFNTIKKYSTHIPNIRSFPF